MTEIVAAADETLVERRMRALSLRNAGATFTQIAERTGVSLPVARKDVDRARRELIDESTRESLIADQRAVILDIRRANYSAMASGDIDAAKIILSSLEREAKLFGLDAPSRSIIGIGTDVEFAESLAALIESVGYRPPNDLLFTARGDRNAQVIDVESAFADGTSAEGSAFADGTSAEGSAFAGGAEGDTRAPTPVIPADEWTNIGRDQGFHQSGYPAHEQAPESRDDSGA